MKYRETVNSALDLARKSHQVGLLITLLVCFFASEIRAQGKENAVVHSLFLVGDAGEPYVKDSPLGNVLREKIRQAGENSAVLFLGDNVYPRGLPPHHSKKYARAESALRTQVEFVQGLETKTIFIPGNHDWGHWGKKGLAYILNQQQWIDSLKDKNIALLPRNGCPGPVQVLLNDKTLLVILDTQWFLHRWIKPGDTDLCHPGTTDAVLSMVEDIFRNNPGKRIIVAGHHPLITYGEHGGIFSWKAHIFPLTELADYLYIPLPLIGSIYPLYRKWFGHIQDTANPVYKKFRKPLQDIIRQYPGTLYVAGHEHALQYIRDGNNYFIGSGSGAKTEYVRKKGLAVFAEDIKGFVEVSVLPEGELFIIYYQVDKNFPTGKKVFSGMLPAHYPAKAGEGY